MKLIKSPRLNARARSKETLEHVMKNRHKSFVIHYSCESFFNLEGRTPRVTSICVKSRQSGEAKVFSIHLQAQLDHIDLSSCSLEEVDKLERTMLSDFSQFVRDHNEFFWIHWNMRNATYGFEAISNRVKIVGAQEFTINDDRKVDLLKVLIDFYTSKFIEDKPKGKMLNIAEYNRISTRDAMTGLEEANAFDDKDYLKLHMSTMRKVEVIDRVLEKLEDTSLIVKTKWRQIYGMSFVSLISLVRENSLLFFIWSILIFVFGLFIDIMIGNM